LGKSFLSELLFIECEDREVRRKARLVKQAGFPRTKRIEDFDFAANPNVPPALAHTLAKGAWIRAGQPVWLIGDSGTGKSHLLIGLGTAAAEAGFKVRYVTAAALVNELVQADDDKHLSKTIARYGRVDLLCLDELGYLELDRRGAELLFQVFTEREERSSIAIASNSAFSEWARTFTDPRLCAAIVDRLTFDASIIETGTESFRLRTTKRRRTSRPADLRVRTALRASPPRPARPPRRGSFPRRSRPRTRPACPRPAGSPTPRRRPPAHAGPPRPAGPRTR
jgi:DNA replication protein DnaC